MSTFTDQSIVVTGASEGIGRALCLALAPQAPRLTIAARNRARLESLREEALAAGAREVLVHPADVTDPEACRALIAAAADTFGGIDVLVCNAGGTMWTRLDEMESLDIFERLMRLNYLGSVYCTYYAVPHLKQRAGRILAMSSVAGLTGVPTRTAYSASKHAMFGFFDSLRVELADAGVSITVAAPDYVLSEIHRRALGPDGQPLGDSPLQEDRIMTAEQCARLCIAGIERRKRLVLTSTRGRVGRWVKLIAPGLMDRIAAKVIRDAK